MALKWAKVFYGSAEMTRNQVFNRMAASAFHLSSKSIDDDTILISKIKTVLQNLWQKFINSSFYVSTETDFE